MFGIFDLEPLRSTEEFQVAVPYTARPPINLVILMVTFYKLRSIKTGMFWPKINQKREIKISC